MTSVETALDGKPTAKLWMTFNKMSQSLQRCLHYERDGNWLGYLSKAAKRVPFLIAAGHHKNGHKSLSLYLKEKKYLPD